MSWWPALRDRVPSSTFKLDNYELSARLDLRTVQLAHDVRHRKVVLVARFATHTIDAQPLLKLSARCAVREQWRPHSEALEKAAQPSLFCSGGTR